ncbi:MAG TPA: hypothetical protein DIU35_11305 [Candidatus Latescibacteria bacterium]|nr:hypothetical protein [Gemmatimonadota bacterium]HCR18060.1 hypothetical protein [Candidatus Latescibacterota bacterium]
MLKKLPSEKKVYIDEETGREVWQMTGGEAVSHSCYQEVEAFTDDERFVVFSSNRRGTFQLFRAELDGGELAQLSDVKDYGSISFGMARNGCEAFYTAGWQIYGVDVATGEDRVVVDLKGKIPNSPNNSAAIALSANGDRCLVSFRRGDGSSTLSMVTIETGDLEELVPWNDHLTHGQFCPGNDRLVTFDPKPDNQNDMDRPMEERVRTLKVDTETKEVTPILIPPYGFRATHEYWDYRGDRLFFHRKTVPVGGPTAICSVNRDGQDMREHFVSDRKFGHSSIDREGKFIVSDVQADTTKNEMYRLDLDTGEADLLCWPNTSAIQDQTIHVHPSISARGNYVDFTSDRCGTSDLYIHPLNQ